MFGIYLCLLLPGAVANERRNLLGARKIGSRVAGAPPGSFLSTEARQRMGDWVLTNMNNIETAFDRIKVQGEQDRAAAVQRAKGDISAEVAEMMKDIGDLINKIQTNTGKSETSRDVLVAASSKIYTDALQGQSDTNDAFIVAQEKAEEMMTSVSGQGEKMITDIETDLGSSKDDYESKLGEMVRGVQTKKEDLVKLIEEIFAEAEEGQDEVRGEVEDGESEEEEQVEEFEGVTDEIKDLYKETRKAARKQLKPYIREFNNIRKAAVKIGSKTAKRASKANRRAAKGIKLQSKELMSELKTLSRDWSDKAREIKSTHRVKSREMGTESKGVRKNFMSTLMAARKTNSADDVELTKNLNDVELSKSDGEREYEDLVTYGQEVMEDSNSELEEMNGDAFREMKAVEGELDERQQRVDETLDSALERLGLVVRDKSMRTGAGVEDAITGRQKLVDETTTKAFNDLEALIAGTTQSAEEIGTQIGAQKVEADNLEAVRAEASSQNDEAQALVKRNLATLSDSFKQDTKALVEAVEDKASGKASGYDAEVEKIGTQLNSASDDALNSLQGVVDAVYNNAESTLQRSGQAVADATTKGLQTMQRLNSTADTIDEFKTKIKEDLPDVQQEVSQSLFDMRDEVDEYDKALKNAQDVLRATITSKDAEATSFARSEVARASETVEGQLSDTLSTVRTRIRKADNQVTAVKGKIGIEHRTTFNFLRTSEENVNQQKIMLDLAKKKMQESVGSAERQLSDLTTQLQAKKQAIRHETQSMLNKLNVKIAKLMQAAGKDAKDGVYMAFERGEEEMYNSKLASEETIEKAANAAKRTLDAQKLQYSKLTDEEKLFQDKFRRLETETHGRDARMETEVAWMNRMDKMLAMEVLFGLRRSEMMKQMSTQSFKAHAQGWLNDLKANDDAQRAQMLSFLHDQGDSLENSVDVINRHTAGATESFQTKTAAELAAILADSTELQGETHSFQDWTRSFGKSLLGNAATLQKDVVSNEERVKAEAEAAAGQTMEAAQHMMNMLYTSAESMNGQKQVSTRLVERLQGDIAAMLVKMQSEADKGATSLQGQIGILADGMPDYASMFQNDTQVASEELNETLAKFSPYILWAKAVMNKTDQQLEGVQLNREQFAERLHNKITTLKGELLNLATETTSHVDLEMRHVDEVAKDMSADMKGFKTQLTNVSNVEFSATDAEVNNITSKLTQLRSQHDSLMDWYEREKYQWPVFKDHVIKALDGMGVQLSEEELQEKRDRVNMQMDNQRSLMNMNRDIEAQLAGNEQADANMLEHQAGSLADGLKAVMASMAKSAQGAGEDDEAIKAELKAKQEKYAQLSTEMESGTSQLTEVMGQLAAAASEADSLRETLRLPLMMGSEGVKRTQKKYDQLFNRVRYLLSHLGGVSFLQVKDALTSYSLAHRRQERSAADTSKVMRSVAALNDLLNRQNMKLERQNKRLENGIQHANAMPLDHESRMQENTTEC